MDTQFMIEQAIKAPSGHNTQPWLFHINENSIEIHPDFSKTLKVVDASHRELFISLGCAAENLCIAAQSKGYTYGIEISNEGIITIQLISQVNEGVTSTNKNLNSLLEQINKRQNNRSVYNGQTIKNTILKETISINQEQNIQLHYWKNGTSEFDQLLRLILKGNEIQMSDPLFKTELKSWMRFNKRHEKKTNDGLSYAVFGAPNLPKWISRSIISTCLTPGIQNKSDRKKINSSSHLILFTIKEDTPKTWIAAGRILERFLLNTTQHDIATAFMNQPCEIASLSEQIQKEVLKENGEEIPILLLRVGYAQPMPYSPRKKVSEVIIGN